MFEEGLKASSWEATDAELLMHTGGMQLKQGLGLRSRWGPTRIIYLNILSRTTSTRFLGTTQHPL